MNGEKGQALPLAILALTIGMLLIAPFLGHASASVIGSRTYADAIFYRNACDAGVEHAIWRLVYGGLQTSLPNPGDHITYSLPETINGVTPSVTITANATGGGATGNITKTVIDTLDFDTGGGYTPDIIKVTSNVCAIAYRGVSNKGYLKTLSVSTNGVIGSSAIDTLAVDTSQCYEPCIIHVTGNIYVIAYRAASNWGYLKTVSIDTNGVIGDSVISTLIFDTSTCYKPSIVQVASNIFAISYRGSSNRGNLKTVSIDANGTISGSVISTLIFDTSACYESRIVQVASNIFAIAYRGSSNRGYLKTVSINSSGIIGGSVISTLIFDTSACYEPSIVQVASNIFAIAYRGSSNRGYLKTVSISSGGAIGASAISTLIFETTTCYEPDNIPIAGDVYAITYRNSTNKGYLKTVSIASDGTIAQTAIDTFNFETSSCTTPRIINIYNNIYTVAYLGAGNDGYLETIGIASGTGVNVYKIVASAGDTSIQAYVSTSDTTASILSWQIK
jgi:hypothetical protein